MIPEFYAIKNKNMSQIHTCVFADMYVSMSTFITNKDILN